MQALRLDPTERTFAQFYEPRSGPWFSRKTVLVVGITSFCYVALGVYVMSQKYGITAFEAPPEPPVVVIEPWRRIIEPPKPVEKRPVAARPTAGSPTADPLPIAQANDGPTDEMPTNTQPTVTTPASPITSVSEPAVPVSPGVIRNPVWISRPTADQMVALYPERAGEYGRTGSATLLCGIRANGTMTGCQVIEESPVGWKFGQAALSLARYFRISPKTIDGVAIEGVKVRIPIVFSLQD